MRAAGRRRKAESIAPDRRPPPPTPTNPADPWQFLSTPVPGRGSDASFCSSRPSIANSGRPSAAVPNISDRAYQQSARATINDYLEASHNLPLSFKNKYPSAKDITKTLDFLLGQLGFASLKTDDDRTLALKLLKGPLKINKSMLSAPGTPHNWPHLLAVIHWLVQIIRYKEFTEKSPPSFEGNAMFMYTMDSYALYLSGEDEKMDELDEQCIREMREWGEKVEDNVKVLEDSCRELEAKLEGLKVGPSPLETAEQEKAELEKNVPKFHMLIEKLDLKMAEVQKMLEDKDNALKAKVADKKRICEENEELKRKIEEQGINSRDAEKMKRELQAVERDIEETEAAKNGWEDKIWELGSEIGHKFKELERFVMECNQAIRRLKLGNGFQYQLNAKGSTPYEVLGLDYKSVIKPALVSYFEDLKRSSMGKLEELASLQKQAGENAAKLEEKRNHIAALESHIDEVEAQLNIMRKEAHEYAARCVAEARKLSEEVDMEAHQISVVEKEAAEFLKTSNAELQETISQTEEEIKLGAQELFNLINSVSAYKEYVGSTIAQMRNDLLEATTAVADIYKKSSSK